MKILHNSSDKLQLRQSPHLPNLRDCLLMLVGMLGFVGIPLLIMSSMSAKLGVMSLQCDRLGPYSVSCQRQKTADFGLVRKPAQTYSNVTGAVPKIAEGKSAKGRTTYDYWVTLLTDQGEVLLLEDPMRVDLVKGNMQEMAALAQQINDFIQSDQPSLSLQRDNRLRLSNLVFFTVFSLFPGLFIVSVYCSLQIEELTFNRELGVLQRKRMTLLGPRSEELPLHSISGAYVETTPISTDKFTQYCLRLSPKSLKARPIMFSRDISEVTAFKGMIKKFLASK